MTDRVKALTVVLDADRRIDDVEHLMRAIRQFRGVLRVGPHVTDESDHVARARVRQEFMERLWGALEER